MVKPLSSSEAILVSLLAATDATWLPCRASHGESINVTVTNVFEARKAYPESGVAWASGERGEAERKESQRSLERLANDGSISVVKPNSTKTLFAKLTDESYHVLRRRCGLPSVLHGLVSTKLVAVLSTRPATFMQDVWIPETKMNRDRGWGDGHEAELVGVSQRSAPALVSGWLESRCDGQRHIYYAITELGWQRLESPPPPFEPHPCDARFVRSYRTALALERSRLASRAPSDESELGFLPLPVSHFDMPLEFTP